MRAILTQPLLVREPTASGVGDVRLQPGDGGTTLASSLVGLATRTVAAGQVRVRQQAGPTVAARFYAITGQAIYEAVQLAHQRLASSVHGGRAARLVQRAQRQAQPWLDGERGPLRRRFLHRVVAQATIGAMADHAETAAGPRLAAALDNQLGPLADQANLAATTVGNLIRRAIGLQYRRDGSGRQRVVTPVNPGPNQVRDPALWTPQYQVAAEPSSGVQTFLTPQWGSVRQVLGADRLRAISQRLAPPQPFVLKRGAEVDLAQGRIRVGNRSRPIGPELVGRWINPAFIDQAREVVALDAGLSTREKVIAEFWEDGPGTDFPPGTWMEFGRFASERQRHDLADDARLFFVLGQALLSASVAAWQVKRRDQSTRPVSAIRELTRLGLLEFPDPITGLEWEPYQPRDRPYAPPFPDYVSGHSTFSAAAGRVLERITHSPRFHGSVTVQSAIEPAMPPVRLEWPTWRDAWRQAGQSRVYGGIHFAESNRAGQWLGEQIGEAVVAKLSDLWS